MRAVILVLLVFAPFTVSADSLAVAKEHYSRANTAYDLQQYADAAHEYEEAFRLKPDPVLLFNIGQAYRNAKDYERAIGAYRSFVRRQPGSPHRAEVEERITDLRALIEAQKREREKPPAGPAAVELKSSEPVVAPPAPPPPAPPPALAPPSLSERVDHRPRNLKIAGTVLALAGAGLAAGGIAFEVMRRSDENALAHPAPGTPYNSSLTDLVQRDRAAEISLFVVGGAAAIAGVATALVGVRRQVTLSPSVAAGHAAISLQMELP